MSSIEAPSEGQREAEGQREMEVQREMEGQNAAEGQHAEEGERKVEGQESVESEASTSSSKGKKRKVKLPTSFLTEEENHTIGESNQGVQTENTLDGYKEEIVNYSPGVISTGENKDKEKEVPVKPSDKQSLFEITKRELSKVKLEEQRKEGVKRARFQALIHVTVSVVSIIVGTITVAIASINNPGLPVTNPMTLVAGLSANSHALALPPVLVRPPANTTSEPKAISQYRRVREDVATVEEFDPRRNNGGADRTAQMTGTHLSPVFLSTILEGTIRFPKKYNPVYDQDSGERAHTVKKENVKVLVISALAFAVAKKGDEHRVSEIEGISDGLKSLFFFYFFLSLPSLLLCLGSIAASVLATEACWGSRCGQESTALLVLACLAVICSVALTTMCIMVIIFFMKFKRAFGLMTEQDRMREMQFRGKMLIKQQSGASQTSEKSNF